MKKVIQSLKEKEREEFNCQLDCMNKTCKYYTRTLGGNCSQFYLLKDCNNYTVRYHSLLQDK